MIAAIAAHLLLQVVSYSSPPSEDTTGYWQQRVHYTIRATLDERAQLLRASGTLRYVNASPDTLHDLYVHQYLNAFRPSSMWSAADEREHRVRFQRLAEPHFGFERLRGYEWPLASGGATPGPGVLLMRGDGSDETLVQVQYPNAPDSTVARIPLPISLAPGDSLLVSFEWEARPSTVPRRQARRGRHWDFAQWYPKVAVYDRRGWQHNPLRPQGELYGEFGTYDVTLIVPRDQVLGATGVPISGDPGWEGVRRWGEVHRMDTAYGRTATPVIPDSAVPPGFKAVRFLARDVHHFAWTAYPAYRHEGSMYDGRIAIHVLYRPGDEPTWGSGQAVERTKRALSWLEALFGSYAYPQITVTHRIDAGATEFPMIIMNSTSSQGLILHELGHVYAYGMLANNEWRSGWMDEGFTDYQTAWAQNLTAPEVARGAGPPPTPGPSGYRGLAIVPEARERTAIERYRRVMLGRAQPIGLPASEFREFALYTGAVYTSSEAMFAALRDLIGDSAFVRFHQLYFARWKMKHVDEPAMRRSAEDACSCKLDWFFDQWVRRTGLTDYAIAGVRRRRSDNGWLTRLRLVRRGELAHRMPVAVRTSEGWTLVRGDPALDEQWVDIRTADEPLEIRLDPDRVTDDWDRRNDAASSLPFLDRSVTRHVIDWPFLDQSQRDRTVVAWMPVGWYGDSGGVAAGVRLRSNYLGIIDRREMGVTYAERVPHGAGRPSRYNAWVSVENPRFFGRDPAMGLRLGAWMLDGLRKAEGAKSWDRSPFLVARGPTNLLTLRATVTSPESREWIDAARWSFADVADASAELSRTSADRRTFVRAIALAGYADSRGTGASSGAFARAMIEGKRSFQIGASSRTILVARAFAGTSTGRTPLQRSIGLSAGDAIETFGNHLARAPGAPLVRPDVGFIPVGHGGMRGYSLFARTRSLATAQVEMARMFWRGTAELPAAWLTLAAGAGASSGAVRAAPSGTVVPQGALADAAVGIALRGKLFDRPLSFRVDVPLFVSRPELAPSRAGAGSRLAFRWAVALEQ